MKTGRNEPCPCGSGKKYKHCCISIARTVSDELKELLSDQEHDSIQELQAAVDTTIARKNRQPQNDFIGLSPEQVYRMLNFPFDTPGLFQISDQLSVEPDAPILMLMKGIVSAINEKGLQATKAKGNLPQKLCREVWSDYSKLYADEISSTFQKVNKEDDFFELHVARIVLELAGFLRKMKGRFYVTKKYQAIFDKSGMKGIYPIIFKTYCREYNWAYGDLYSDAPFIQQSFLFTLYMLQQHGDKMTFTSNYEDGFLRAFPMVIDEIDSSPYSTPEEDLRRCYYLRAYKRFLVFLGLAELEITQNGKPYENTYKIKKTSLFDAVITFNFLDANSFKSICSSIDSDHLH